jgi:hypothetical protein
MSIRQAPVQDELGVSARFAPAGRLQAPVLPTFLAGVAVGALVAFTAVGLVLWLLPTTRAAEKPATPKIFGDESSTSAIERAHEPPAIAPSAPSTSSQDTVPVVVQPEPPDEGAVRTKPAPSKARPGSRLTEAGVREWLRHLASAWEAKDLEALRALGIGDTDAEAEAVRTRLARQAGHVSIAKLQIFVGREYARVAFNLVASDSRGKRVAKSEAYQLERLPDGSIVRRHD